MKFLKFSRRRRSMDDEQVQFIMPKGVSWTVEELFALEASRNYREALERWKVLLAPFQHPKLKMDPRIARMKSHRIIWLHIGLCYRYLERYSEALEAYSKAEALARDAGDSDTLADVHNCMGIIYRNQGEVDKALRLYSQALREAKSLGDLSLAAAAHDNIAVAYRVQGQSDKALKEEQKAYDLFSSEPSAVKPDVQARVLGMLGVMYLELGRRDEGIRLLKQGLVRAREAGNREQESIILENLEKAG